MSERVNLWKSYAGFVKPGKSELEQSARAQDYTVRSIWDIRGKAERLYDPRQVNKDGAWRYFGYSKPLVRSVARSYLGIVLRELGSDDAVKQLEERNPAFWVILSAEISEKALRRREKGKRDFIEKYGRLEFVDRSLFSKEDVDVQIAVEGTQELAKITIPYLGLDSDENRRKSYRFRVKPNSRILLAEGVVANIEPAADMRDFPLDRFAGKPDSAYFLMPGF